MVRFAGPEDRIIRVTDRVTDKVTEKAENPDIMIISYKNRIASIKTRWKWSNPTSKKN